MMVSKISALVALAAVFGVIQAAPNNKESSSSSSSHTTSHTSTATQGCATYVDTFDNFITIPLAPEAEPVGIYNGIQYTDFDYVPDQVAGVGLIPVSPPNSAAASVNQDAATGNVTLSAFGVLSTANTTTKYFDLVEFYYACLLFDNGVPVPIGCSIAVTGVDVHGKQVPTASFNYAPTSLMLANMNRAVLPFLTFIGLKEVIIGIATSAAAVAADAVLYVDNVEHINCY